MDAGIASKKLTVSLKSMALVGPVTNLKRHPNRLTSKPLSRWRKSRRIFQEVGKRNAKTITITEATLGASFQLC